MPIDSTENRRMIVRFTTQEDGRGTQSARPRSAGKVGTTAQFGQFFRDYYHLAIVAALIAALYVARYQLHQLDEWPERLRWLPMLH